ncbi:g7719 [Coccomyxa elongata]
MALRTLKGGGISIGTELETVLNVIIYVLLGGVLPWHNYRYEGAGHIAERQGYMTLSFEEQVLAKAPCEARSWLRRMRNLFFQQGTYNTDVTCQQFLQACTLEP